jgi:K+-sensing histidine kinase KdpD
MNAPLSAIRLRNASGWASGERARWLVALYAYVVALLIRMALQPLLDDEAPLLFFSIAAVAVQYYYGLAPALLVAVLGLLTGDYFFLEPYQSFTWPEWEDVADIVYNIASTVCLMVLIHEVRRARYESALLAEIAESRYRMLLDAEVDRKALETETQARAV